MSIKGFDRAAPDDALGIAGSRLSRRLASLLYGGGREDASLKAVARTAAFRSNVGGSWPASAAAAAAAIGFGTSWDAGYDFNISSGSPTNNFGSTALTATGNVLYGAPGPFTNVSSKAVSVQNKIPEIREVIAPVLSTINPSTTSLTQVGDLIVAIGYFNSSSPPAPQAGWTSIGSTTDVAAAYKVASSGGANAYQAYASGFSASLHVLKAGTFDVTQIASATATGTTLINPASVSLYDNSLVIVGVGYDYPGSSSASFTAPAGYSGLVQFGGSAFAQGAAAYKVFAQTGSASEDPGTFSDGLGSANASGAITIAFGALVGAAGKAASSSVFDVTSGDVVIAWLAWIGEGSSPARGYIVDKLSSSNGYAVALDLSGTTPVIKFTCDTTAANTVTCDVQLGQWHVGIATYKGSTGVMTLGTKSLGGAVSTATATDASHSGLTSGETFQVHSGQSDWRIAGLLIGASTTGSRVGTLTTTGNMATALESLRQAVIAASYTLTASAGAYVLTGTAATLRRAYTLTIGSGSYSLTGTAAALKKAGLLSADAGSYALTGTAAALKRAYTLAASVGAYSLTGTAAAFLRALRLASDAGTYSLTGSAVGLTRARVLSASAGAFAAAGTAASLLLDHRLVAGSGNIVLAGGNAGLSIGRVLSTGSGTYTLNAVSGDLRRSLVLLAGGGSYGMTGNNVTFGFTSVLGVETGVYTFTGNTATLTHVVPALSSGWGYRIRPRFGIRIGFKPED